MARILIVEDHEPFAKLVIKLLSRHGYEVLHATDGIDALLQIDSALPDLLLLDLRLPRLSGIDLLKKLRSQDTTKQLPVVILTGAFKGEKFAQGARTLGVEHFLEKPSSAEKLLSAIKATLPHPPKDPVSEQKPRPFAAWLQHAFITPFTGLMTLTPEGGDVPHRILFLQGIPLALQPGFSCAGLGDHLLQRGMISREEFSYFKESGEGRHDLLIRMGCFDYPVLLQEKLSFLNEQLTHAFTLGNFSAQLQPLAALPLMQPSLVNVPQLLLRGFHQQSRKELPAKLLDQYIAPSPDFFRFINFFTPSLGEKDFLKQMNGQRTVRECIPEGEYVGALLQTLRALNMVQLGPQPLTPADPGEMPLRVMFADFDDEEIIDADTPVSFDDLVGDEDFDLDLRPDAQPEQPSPAQPSTGEGEEDLPAKVRRTHGELKGKDYYAVFGMKSGNFSIDKLKSRYFELTRQFGPEVLMQLYGEEATLVQEILSTVTNAYNTLSDVVKKERYDEMLGSENIGLGREGDDVFQAQVQFQSGKVFLDMEEWDSAEKALNDAHSADPQNGEYLANLAWAIYRNPRNQASRAALDKARQTPNRSLSHEKTADGFAYKGWMLFESGQDALAEAEFNKALKVNARSNLARRGLRQIQEKREAEKKGLFRKMFR